MIKRSGNGLTPSVPRARAKRMLVSLLMCSAALGVMGTAFFYEKYRTAKAAAPASTQQETASIVAAVGKLIELPEHEIPTTATISNEDALRHQPFFASVENGDVLIAYATAMKAILYRPRTNKIINVASLVPQP